MNAPDSKRLRKEAYEANKLEKRLRRLVGQAIADYDMIHAGDRVMVCLSGGKDSYGLLDVLQKLRAIAPVAFEIVAVNLDQRHPGFPEHVLPDYLRAQDIPFHIEVQDTHSIVKRLIPEGRTMCSLCSRLRRGVLGGRRVGRLGRRGPRAADSGPAADRAPTSELRTGADGAPLRRSAMQTRLIDHRLGHSASQWARPPTSTAAAAD